MSGKKILFVSESLWNVGAVYDLHIFAEGLSKKGYEVYAVDPGYPGHAGTNGEFINSSRYFDDAKVNHLSIDLSALSKRDTWFLESLDQLKIWITRFRVLKSIVKRGGFDRIVLYSAARMGPQAVLVALAYGANISFRSIDLLHVLWPPGVKRMIVRFQEIIVSNLVDRIYAMTTHYVAYQKMMVLCKDKVMLLKNPLDTLEKFVPQSKSEARRTSGLQQHDFIVLFMGYLYNFCGVREFVIAVADTFKRNPSLKLIILGAGESQQVIRDASVRLGIESQVVFAGHVEMADLPRWIATADLCINTMIMDERTKNIFNAKILQYFACQRPVLSLSRPGVMIDVESEKSGIVYVDSLEEMARFIQTVVSGEVDLTEKSMLGRHYVVKENDYRALIDQMMADEHFFEC
jgi:glycosyltransferase involved in cell wall biosynthesis